MPDDPNTRPAGLSFLFDLFAANQRIKQLLADAFAGCELRPDEFAVYSTLFDYGPITATQMAEACGMPPTTIATYIREMLARGHLSRAANAGDRRSYLLSLTPRGQVAHADASRALDEAERRMLAVLDPGEREVRAALRGLERAAAAAREDLTRASRTETG